MRRGRRDGVAATAALPPTPWRAFGLSLGLAFCLPMGLGLAAPAGSAGSAEPPSLSIPVAGVAASALRDSFDEGRPGHRHEAIDIGAARGTPVLAAADGRLVKLYTSVPGGLTIYQFDASERYALYYAHLDRYAEGLREGAPLRRGDVIGYVGSSGNAPANAPHLHFALFRLGPEKRWWQGEPLNPYPLLTAAPLSGPH